MNYTPNIEEVIGELDVTAGGDAHGRPPAMQWQNLPLWKEAIEKEFQGGGGRYSSPTSWDSRAGAVATKSKGPEASNQTGIYSQNRIPKPTSRIALRGSNARQDWWCVAIMLLPKPCRSIPRRRPQRQFRTALVIARTKGLVSWDYRYSIGFPENTYRYPQR